jgi:SAM-dependent methyltransferase
MAKINSPAELMETVNAFRLSRVILTAFELELFSHLGKEGKPSGEIAKEIRTDARATDRLMNVLVGCGLLEKKNNVFKNTPLSAKLMVKGSPAFMGGFGHTANLWHSWTTLTDAVRKGSTVITRDPINDRSTDWIEPFIAAMHQRGKQQATELATMLDLSAVDKILDVGGGSGAFSFAFVDKKPGLKAIVYDLPNVLLETKKYIEKEGYSGRVDTLAGDYLTNPLGSGYDICFLSAVIHSNSPNENKLLFKKCADAMNKGGQLVVLDHIMSEDRTSPFGGALFSLNMLVGTEAGDTYTESEVKSWMTEAGFGNFERKESESGTSLIIGK